MLVVLPLFAVVPGLGACLPANDGAGSAHAPEQIEAIERVEAIEQAEATRQAASEPTGTPSVQLRDLPALVDDATWVTRQEERALVVSPSRLLRETHSAEVHDEAWRRVVVAIPEADTPGMRDQFVCHAVFATAKQAWYLEPARPAVGYGRTVSAGCNPGDVTDVG